MLLPALCCLALLATVAMALVLLAPMRLQLSVTCRGRSTSWALLASWLHPKVLSLHHASGGKPMECTVLFHSGPLRTAAGRSRSAAPEVEAPAAQAAHGRPGLLARARRSRLLFFLRQHHWRRKALASLRQALRRLPAVVKLDKLNIDVQAHLDDPARLGALSGYVNAAGWALAARRRSKVHIGFVPLFDRPGFAADGCLALRTSVARLLWPGLAAALCFPWVATLLLWRASRKRRPTGGMLSSEA